MLSEYRKFFAEYIVRQSGSIDQELINAFSMTPRENYLGNGPWDILTSMGYIKTPNDDPRYIYSDNVIGIDPKRTINSGQPTLHASCLHALSIKKNDTVIHVGSGTGYYSAIISNIVGEHGKVISYEIDEKLSFLAKNNLSDFPWVTVISGSGANTNLPRANAIYVNAGATHPNPSWLKSVFPSGKILFPLHPINHRGGMLLLSATENPSVWKAKFISPAVFIGCIGVQDTEQSDFLAASFAKGSLDSVRSLHLQSQPDETVWHTGNDWWLSTKPV